MFLDLATQLGPCCLFSRDTEVLRLKRPAARFGVHIATPAEFEPLMKRGGQTDRP